MRKVVLNDILKITYNQPKSKEKIAKVNWKIICIKTMP